MLLEIHRSVCCEEVNSREWEQTHEKSVSQTGGMQKSIKLWEEHKDMFAVWCSALLY